MLQSASVELNMYAYYSVPVDNEQKCWKV